MTTINSLSALDGTPHANVFPDSEPKTIRLTLEAGEVVDPHRHPGQKVVFFVLEGAVELHLDAETFELAAGDVAHFDGDQEISSVASEDSVALVVLARATESG